MLPCAHCSVIPNIGEEGALHCNELISFSQEVIEYCNCEEIDKKYKLVSPDNLHPSLVYPLENVKLEPFEVKLEYSFVTNYTTKFSKYIQYLVKTTGRSLARVIDFHVFFVKFKTVKCDFKAFVSKKYKKKKLIIFQFFLQSTLP